MTPTCPSRVVVPLVLARLIYLVIIILLFSLLNLWKWFPRETASAPSGAKSTLWSFNLHMGFMILAWTVFATEGVLAYATWERSSFICGQPTRHSRVKVIHASLNFICAVMTAMGLLAIFQNHAVKEIPPLYSAHSWLGIITASLTFIAALAGTVFFLLAKKLGISKDVRARVAPWHRLVGLLAYFLGLATCSLGIQEKQGFITCASGRAYCLSKTLLTILVILVYALGACVAYVLSTQSDRGTAGQLEREIDIFEDASEGLLP